MEAVQEKQRSVAFYTLGCKLNYSETSAIARQFEKSGYRVNEFEDGADVYVLNTCSVTDNADKKCRKLIRDARKVNPDARVVVIGCYAQLKPKEISRIPGVNLVLGANEKFNVINYVDKLGEWDDPRAITCHIKDVEGFNNAWSFGDRTRSFLKVQDGCNYFCSFCTIPLARGRSRSDTISNIVASAKEIAAKGVNEIVLTGVNIGDFGDPHYQDFLQLVQALDEVEGISRFRISSIEPNLLSNEIIEFVAQSKKFVPHFHIPLQSGSDKILKMMRRRYERQLYADRVANIRQLMPDCCIGVDVIVGFPGETEEDFMETFNFLHSLDINYLHVFTYSERPNTTAVRMEGKVPMTTRTARRKMLTNLSHKKRRAFYAANLGRTEEVLFEGKEIDGQMFGFTRNYVKVKTSQNENWINTIQTMKLKEIDGDRAVVGEPVEVSIV